MAHVNSVENRPRTAVLLQAKLLNTEKLSQLGVDMALTRSEGFSASLAKFILPVHGVGGRKIIKHLATIQRKSSGEANTQQNNLSASTCAALSPVKLPFANARKIQPVRNVTTAIPDIVAKTPAVPLPCTSCQRSDLPERFHSHPQSPAYRNSSSHRQSTPLKSRFKFQLQKLPNPTERTSADIRKICLTNDIQENHKPLDHSSAERTTSNGSDTSVPLPCPVETFVSNCPAGDRRMLPSSKQNRFLLCYICGRMFGTSSLRIHEPQCYQKWERENFKLPSCLRRPPPDRPGYCSTLEEWNMLAYASFESTLVPCWKCGRTFVPERLSAHAKMCRQSSVDSEFNENKVNPNQKASSSSAMTVTSRETKQRPTVTCYICGREYGTRSVLIHEPQCLQKWQLSNSRLPAHLQKPEPIKTNQK